MKHLLLMLALGISLGASAEKVQCHGTTVKNAQCKRQINTEAPSKAVKGSSGHWYCSQHAKQAK